MQSKAPKRQRSVLNNEKVDLVVRLLNNGNRVSDIAHSCGMSERTVQRVRNKCLDNLSQEDFDEKAQHPMHVQLAPYAVRKRGRPRGGTVSEKLRTQIQFLLSTEPNLTLLQLKDRLVKIATENAQLSTSTIHRAVRDAGFCKKKVRTGVNLAATTSTSPLKYATSTMYVPVLDSQHHIQFHSD